MSDAEKPLHVRVAEALGTTPRIDYQLMDRDERGIYISFDTRYEADTYLENALAIAPRGLIAREGGHVVERKHYPIYDTDWSATGPLIERFGIVLGWNASLDAYPALAKISEWWASENLPDQAVYYEVAPTALGAICALILTLHAAGRLKT